MQATASRNADAIHADYVEDPDHRRRFAEGEMALAVTRAMTRFRTSRGLSLAELGERVGRSALVIELLEAGEYARCPLPVLRTIARALGYDMEVDILLSMFHTISLPMFAHDVGIEPWLDAQLRQELVHEPAWASDPAEAAACTNRSRQHELKIGDVITATVIAVSRDALQVDVGGAEAVLPIGEVTIDPKSIAVGSTFDVAVHRVHVTDGTLYVSERRARALASWREIVRASRLGDVVWGMFREVIKGGVVVDVSGVSGFIPASQLDGPIGASFSKHFDQPVPLKVINVDKKARRAVLSLRQGPASKLEVGKVVRGTVAGLANFGAFVDLGGVDGLVHLSELAHHQPAHPSNVVAVGDEVDVRVIGVDADGRKIKLSMKRAHVDPWVENAKLLREGNTVRARVAKVGRRSLLVELAYGLLATVPSAEFRIGTEYVPGSYIDVILIVVDRHAREITASALARPKSFPTNGFAPLGEELKRW
ncbi:MAG TPA: S1 RNA-binding domain-containing protein [Candidatus Limnocylindrales bacterium]|nr:S1 RNA-binding domain-containing protein [Candidatus Limnocylindrales bacterium]